MRAFFWGAVDKISKIGHAMLELQSYGCKFILCIIVGEFIEGNVRKWKFSAKWTEKYSADWRHDFTKENMPI